MKSYTLVVLLLSVSVAAFSADMDSLPVYEAPDTVQAKDWLVEAIPEKAAVYRSAEKDALILSNGLLRRKIRLSPNAATVALDNLMTGESLLRGVKPEAEITLDGRSYAVGGLKGQPNYAFLLPEWEAQLTADPAAMRYVGLEVGPIEARINWKQVRHHAPDAAWPPKGIHLRMDYRMSPDHPDLPKAHRFVSVAVHYNLYDGIPLISKWIEVKSASQSSVVLDAFTCELLAAVEYGSTVDMREGTYPPPNLHVETDYAFRGMSTWDTTKFSVHWEIDPDYQTQVNYQRLTPCLLKVSPEMGPGVTLNNSDVFTSFRLFVLLRNGFDRERNGLSQRRMYRVLAPWVTENPLMMHARFADWKQVKLAIDQCAEVGFEMVILTFGSGFNIEDDSATYKAKMKDYADYARSKGVEIGGYSLLASRSIDKKNDVVMPEGTAPTFGHSPCLLSAWGQDYFRKLYEFYPATGFMLLEHDGSYPGDECMSEKHPGHTGLADSRWLQWRKITDFYQWCRSEGIYLNVPDYYYLAGTNKSGMGYRETNWSLPRAQQVIHTRQNIYDGTWEKTPSMGWMFVPLTEYHGGGAAATIEPLAEHLDHYERMLTGNLAFGVQACYRGPRLFDTEETKAMVTQWVDWYKTYRAILESDMIHGRRADGRDIDWMLHVNPALQEKGLLAVFNPLKTPVTRTVEVDLYYTGLKEIARIRREEGESVAYTLDKDHSVSIDLEMAPESFTWYVIE